MRSRRRPKPNVAFRVDEETVKRLNAFQEKWSSFWVDVSRSDILRRLLQAGLARRDHNLKAREEAEATLGRKPGKRRRRSQDDLATFNELLGLPRDESDKYG